MHIEHIALKNFKCFKEIALSFPKLTILTGANSSGKSSLLDAVLVPFQSAGFPLYLSPNGKYVNMGDFRQMSHGHSRKSTVGHDITINADSLGKLTFNSDWIMDLRTALPRLKNLAAKGAFLEIGLNYNEANGKYVLRVQHDAKSYAKSREFRVEKTVNAFMISIAKLSSENKSQKRNEREKALRQIFQLDNIPNKVIAGLDEVQERLKSVANKLTPASILMDERLNFISSFRLPPERTYYERTRANAKIGLAGENHIEQIVEWERRKSEEFTRLQESLKKLQLVEEMKTQRVGGGRFELDVKTASNRVWSALTDVGCGISQFLPIAVADIQLGNNSTLAVAQPEIHLHPSVQASLGGYFVDGINTKSKRYIIETHSEYLLHRIRLLIAREELNPKDVAVYHFHGSKNHTQISKVEFSKSGRIEGAPQDFFDTYMIDVMEIAMSAS